MKEPKNIQGKLYCFPGQRTKTYSIKYSSQNCTNVEVKCCYFWSRELGQFWKCRTLHLEVFLTNSSVEGESVGWWAIYLLILELFRVGPSEVDEGGVDEVRSSQDVNIWPFKDKRWPSSIAQPIVKNWLSKIEQYPAIVSVKCQLLFGEKDRNSQTRMDNVRKWRK